MKRFNPNDKIDLEELLADFDETAAGFCPLQQTLVRMARTPVSQSIGSRELPNCT
ncbi:MAG: hypothetical protein ACFB12_00160 [Leptolyngbyaceae cyanobacterium]